MIDQIKKFLKSDKTLHMICCFAIVVIFGLILNVVSGIALALIASFGKEAYDEVKYKGRSWYRDWERSEEHTSELQSLRESRMPSSA